MNKVSKRSLYESQSQRTRAQEKQTWYEAWAALALGAAAALAGMFKSWGGEGMDWKGKEV